MKAIGIIAEFNPFHNGHAYIISEAKKRLDADFCVVVMSGSFTQRGEPACMYKYDRVRMALMCDADAVLELPVSYATASAEAFAYGGVSILSAIGVTDTLVFGAENDDLTALNAVSDILTNPSEEYCAILNAGLKKGLTYPAARAAALPEYADILSSPNNILAIEYLKALKTLSLSIMPYAVKRYGSGYHDNEISEYASAEAIRAEFGSKSFQAAIRTAVPKPVSDIMSASYLKTFPVTMDDLTDIAEYILLTESADTLREYQDMNRDIANRFINLATDYFCGNGENSETKERETRLTDFIKAARTKELTYTRLSRAMLHTTLRLKSLIRSLDGTLKPCPYTRLLGFREDASDLMRAMSKRSEIPIITKAGDAGALLDNEAYPLFNATIHADRIYDMLIRQKYGTRLTDTCRIAPIHFHIVSQ